MKVWSCRILTDGSIELKDKVFEPKSTEVPVSTFTVGRKLQLQCKGEATLQTGEWTTKFVSEKEEKIPSYFIGTPEFIDETTLNLQIASYKVGEQNPKFLLTNGNEQVELQVETFTVTSILEKHDYIQMAGVKVEGQGPHPYPLLGANRIEYPLLLWILLAVLLAAASVFFIRKWIHYYQLRRWVEGLEERKLAVSPERFFYKEVRSLQREKLSGQDGYKKLENAYFTFLEHRFVYPVRSRSVSDVTKYILRHHSLPKNVLIHLKRNLLELKKLQAKAKALNDSDLEKMGEMLRKNVDEVHDVFSGKAK